MGIFSTRPPVSSEEYDWLVACFAWLRLVLDDTDIRPELVLPDHPALLSARTGPELFDAVRDLMDMSDWPCRLVKVDDDFDPGDARIQQEGTSACGTFSVEDREAVIRYSSAMLRNPDALAATFAHELCHYLLVEAGDPPGGPDLMEHSTDCAAAYLLRRAAGEQRSQFRDNGPMGNGRAGVPTPPVTSRNRDWSQPPRCSPIYTDLMLGPSKAASRLYLRPICAKLPRLSRRIANFAERLAESTCWNGTIADTQGRPDRSGRPW
ncbi:MAG: hypothetical protein R3D99_03565 [Altererythrobacter sp.]